MDASGLEYITTFLERDLPQLGINIPARTLRQFWTMLNHNHSQILNYAELGRSFGVSDMTVHKYCDILEGTFVPAGEKHIRPAAKMIKAKLE